ncbi:hypothetical protein [Acinetobacter pittii]|uniref:hypothetical protein n=1 Tax=Acinetobacter pittii TaxID=48296 RepID=UPI00325FF102
MIYEVEVIKAQGIGSLERKIQEWLNNAPSLYDRFKLISISHAFEPGSGYRAIIAFQKG